MTEAEALRALRATDLNWVVHLDGVWSEPPHDVPELHGELRAAFARRLEDMERPGRHGSPLGWVVTAPGGFGKTHLLAALRREAARRGHPFVMVDLIGVRDFWESVLQGYVHSLQQRLEGGSPQYRWILKNIIERLGPNEPVARALATLADNKSAGLKDDMIQMIRVMHHAWPAETMKYQNVIRAVVCMNSDDFTISNLGQTWLQAQALEPEEKRELGFTAERESPRAIVEALSWFMSLGGPTVVAFDQLDAIVNQLDHRREGESPADARAATESIVADVGNGLGALRDVTRNTLTVVSCLETTWNALLGTTLRTALDRFEPVRKMTSLQTADRALALARRRLEAAYRDEGVSPPYPTYPFRPEAFDALANSSPREVLKRCGAHIARMINSGRIEEVKTLGDGAIRANGEPKAEGRFDGLDRDFEALRAQADPAWILQEKHDDERLAPLLRAGLVCLARETDGAADALATVDETFTGGAKTAPLHARLRRVFPGDQEREDHFCVRAIQHSNAKAYQNQLTAALATSGVDRRLRFRRLAIVRSIPVPGGAKTAELTRLFDSLGGVFVAPADDDLRALHALHALRTRGDANFHAWLRERRPASALPLIRDIVGAMETPLRPGTETPEVVDPPPRSGGSHEGGETPPLDPDPVVALGRQLIGGTARDPVTLPLRLLSTHALMMAGSGSGKTMFLRRLVEEAALGGVPSIVIDCANDLAALGDRWDERPPTWTEEDAEKADRYHVPGRVVVWTPGRSDGNPIWFEPLPDLADLVGDPESLTAAIDSACESLHPIVARGRTQASDVKRAILSSTLRYIATRGGRGLDELIEVLSDLPPEAGLGTSKDAKHASEMADSLRAARELDPLLKARGTPFDPGALLVPSTPDRPARVSVISLVGLTSLESRRRFINQLSMALFSWILQNPAPADKPLLGLLTIDEARDFIPSRTASICNESLLRLVSQGRKYGLGLVFATQNPKDVDNRLASNCATHVYGRMNSPATIEAAKELIRQKGGTGDDLARLSTGRFYVHNADSRMPAPIRVETAFSLSRHPRSPLDEAAVLDRAARFRPA